MLGNMAWWTAAIVIIFAVAARTDNGESLDSVGALLALIQSDGNQLVFDCPGDMKAVTELYREINKMTQSTSSINANGREIAYKLQQQTRSYIVHKKGRMLANLLNGPYTQSEAYKEFVKQAITDFDIPIISAIFTVAIDEIYHFKPIDVLAFFVWQIYNYHLPNDKTAFAVMFEQQLQLFWKFQRSGNYNDLYIFNVSYYFYKIKNGRFYKDLDANKKRQLEKAIKALPSTMQNLYFKPYFCLLNKGLMENIYTAEYTHDWDSNRRTVYSWNDQSWVGTNGYWQHEIKEDSSGSSGTLLDLKFSLLSDKFRLFLYMDRHLHEHNNIIAVWKSGSAPPDSAWNVELIDNQLVFSQNGFIMCNSNQFHNAARRFVYGFQDMQHTKYSEECQWILDSCERYK